MKILVHLTFNAKNPPLNRPSEYKPPAAQKGPQKGPLKNLKLRGLFSQVYSLWLSNINLNQQIESGCSHAILGMLTVAQVVMLFSGDIHILSLLSRSTILT